MFWSLAAEQENVATLSPLRAYLLEREGLGLLLGGAHLPHAHHCTCSTRNHQLGVGADGTEDLAPLGQTFINSHRL